MSVTLRRNFLPRFILLVVLPVTATIAQAAQQATGIKIVEVSPTSAVVWTRLTRNAERVADDGPLPTTKLFDRTNGKEIPLRDNATYTNARPVVTFPPGVDMGSIRGAAAGAPGQTRVRFRAAGDAKWSETAWKDVDSRQDFTAVFALAGLQPQLRYEVAVEGRADAAARVASTTAGGFVTAPAATAGARVSFAVMSCQQYEDRDRPDGLAIYPAMLALRPDFFVNTGDAVYYDHGPVHAVNADLARYHWARMYGLPTLRDFHRQVGSYFMKDDHDVLTNDSEPGAQSGDLTFAEGLKIFHEQTALSVPPYRTVRWGRHLQVWMMEGRDFRTAAGSPPNTPRTIWGAAQIAWLERTLAESDASFRVLIAATPLVGPDRTQKDDNYSNAGFSPEGARMRALLARHPNLIVINGDRHWQYVSIDKATGLEEWSVGAATDSHAGGWNETTMRPEHRFLRTKFGGFLSGEVKPAGASATLTLRLHDTAGKVVFEATKPPTR